MQGCSKVVICAKWNEETPSNLPPAGLASVSHVLTPAQTDLGGKVPV